MGGYSYGAMVTMQLPILQIMSSMFSAPEIGSYAAEIRLRAQHLAEQQNAVLSKVLVAKIEHHRDGSSPRSLAMRVGYSDAGDHRKSHDSRRSFSLEEAEEKLRRGVSELLGKAKGRRKLPVAAQNASGSQAVKDADNHGHLEPLPTLQTRRAAYLLISPLQGPVSHLTAIDFKSLTVSSWFSRKTKATESASSSEATALDKEEREQLSEKAMTERKLQENPTFVAFGDSDIFVAAKRLRDWARKLELAQGSRFVAHEIPTAGHFWVEEGVAYDMSTRAAAFAKALIDES
jgi:hypothetical protein